MGAETAFSAHGRCIDKALVGKYSLQRTREAEWRLAPGGRSRPRLVSGRGPADKAGKDRPKAVPGRSQLPSATTTGSGVRRRSPAHTSGGFARLMCAKRPGFAHKWHPKERDGCGNDLQRTREAPNGVRRVVSENKKGWPY